MSDLEALAEQLECELTDANARIRELQDVIDNLVALHGLPREDANVAVIPRCTITHGKHGISNIFTVGHQVELAIDDDNSTITWVIKTTAGKHINSGYLLLAKEEAQ